ERKLFEYPRDVRLDGCDAHVELAADLSVGLAEPDRDGNLAFALAEAVELLAGVALAVVGHPVSDVPDQPAGDRWGEDRGAGGAGPAGPGGGAGGRVPEGGSPGPWRRGAPGL